MLQLSIQLKQGENSWTTNFDSFENILNKKQEKSESKDKDTHPKHRDGREERANPKDQNSREPIKWYCKAYNRPDGCPEQNSYWSRIGNRDHFVQHICAVCLLRDTQKVNHPSGRSRISRRVGGGRAPVTGGMDLRRGHFLVKMYAKTKELGPIGGGMRRAPPLDPPMHPEGHIDCRHKNNA